MDYGLPVLKANEFTAVINIVGTWIGKPILDIKPRKSLTWDDIRYLQKTGVVQFGSHTWNLHKFKHGVITSERDVLNKDFKKFKVLFKNITGEDVNIMAWPYGWYNDLAIAVAMENGYRYLQTSEVGRYNGQDVQVPRIAMKKGMTIQDIMK
jgi:biofilm PGA synthesis lipoprotein PgaB